jgi:hypothetical protein
MTLFAKISAGIETGRALAELAAAGDLWGADPDRTSIPDSPHEGVPDIWLRCRPRREIDSPARFGEPHFSEFYPAWHRLPSVHPLVFGVMAWCKATMLGFCMISKIPPGGQVKPHSDNGWHAHFYDKKAYVILQANDRCVNTCGDEQVVMATGDIYLFENRVLHSVRNDGDTPRIALIITMRTK